MPSLPSQSRQTFLQARPKRQPFLAQAMNEAASVGRDDMATKRAGAILEVGRGAEFLSLLSGVFVLAQVGAFLPRRRTLRSHRSPPALSRISGSTTRFSCPTETSAPNNPPSPTKCTAPYRAGPIIVRRARQLPRCLLLLLLMFRSRFLLNAKFRRVGGRGPREDAVASIGGGGPVVFGATPVDR